MRGSEGRDGMAEGFAPTDAGVRVLTRVQKFKRRVPLSWLRKWAAKERCKCRPSANVVPVNKKENMKSMCWDVRVSGFRVDRIGHGYFFLAVLPMCLGHPEHSGITTVWTAWGGHLHGLQLFFVFLGHVGFNFGIVC